MITESFRKELKELINYHSIENESDTPDFLLADYLMECLETYNKAVKSRETWYGREPKFVDAPSGPTEPGLAK